MGVWIHDYLPKNSSEVVGQEQQMIQLKRFIENFKNERKKACLIHGPAGSGKTSSIYALAKDVNLEVFELNASDFRNKDSIEKILGSALTQQSLFSRGKLVLVDEVDGISGTKDRGGLIAITKLIAKSKFPVILAANNILDKKFSSLRKACTVIEYAPLDANSVVKVLKRISEKEKLIVDEAGLTSLAIRSAGDVRAAINDLQTLTMKSKELKKNDFIELGEREKKEGLTNALLRVFKTTDPGIAITAYDNVTENLDVIQMWIDENLPKEYTSPQDLSEAYAYLSKSDVMFRRIRRWQHWRFLVYVNAYLSAGIAVSKKEKYKKMIDFKQSTRPLKIYLANMKYAKRKGIAVKIAEKTHTSAKRAIEVITFIKHIFKNNEVEANKLAEYFELDEDEILWLKR